jgi:chromosome segregation ATPase
MRLPREVAVGDFAEKRLRVQLAELEGERDRLRHDLEVKRAEVAVAGRAVAQVEREKAELQRLVDRLANELRLERAERRPFVAQALPRGPAKGALVVMTPEAPCAL